MPVERTKRKGNMAFHKGVCQNCLDLCKRQLCTDPVTRGPPPSLRPEPLGLGKGRDSPPSLRASQMEPHGRSTAGTDAHFWDSIIHLSGERGWALPRDADQTAQVCMGPEQPRKGAALGIGGRCGRQRSMDL